MRLAQRSLTRRLQRTFHLDSVGQARDITGRHETSTFHGANPHLWLLAPAGIVHLPGLFASQQRIGNLEGVLLIDFNVKPAARRP